MNLDELNLEQLDQTEMKKIDGGNWGRVARAVLAAAVAIHEAVCDGGPHISLGESGESY